MLALIFFRFQTSTWPLFSSKKVTEMYRFDRILWFHSIKTYNKAKNRLFCPLFFLPNRLLSPIFSRDTNGVPIRVSLLEETECTIHSDFSLHHVQCTYMSDQQGFEWSLYFDPAQYIKLRGTFSNPGSNSFCHHVRLFLST